MCGCPTKKCVCGSVGVQQILSCGFPINLLPEVPQLCMKNGLFQAWKLGCAAALEAGCVVTFGKSARDFSVYRAAHTADYTRISYTVCHVNSTTADTSGPVQAETAGQKPAYHRGAHVCKNMNARHPGPP